MSNAIKSVQVWEGDGVERGALVYDVLLAQCAYICDVLSATTPRYRKRFSDYTAEYLAKYIRDRDGLQVFNRHVAVAYDDAKADLDNQHSLSLLLKALDMLEKIEDEQ